MKRNLIIGLFGLGAAALLGCPVGFQGTQGGGGACYNNLDCAPGTFCDYGYCIPGEGGFADASNCALTGCPAGEVCTVVNAAATCVALTDGAQTLDSGDSSFTGCTSNSECAEAGAGSLCLDGTCVPPSNQCTDTQQCPNYEQCVSGACVPACQDGSCPSGYSCDPNTGVCTGNPTPCGGADGGMTCAPGTTCVEQHCVPTCNGADGSCPTGEICVDNGCVPPQKAIFVCNTDGQAGDGKSGDCDVGSTCLHHACYIACDPEAGNACKTADQFNECVKVQESTDDGGTGTYYVCGSSTSLGSQCSPTLPCTGSGSVCIDGYCK